MRFSLILLLFVGFSQSDLGQLPTQPASQEKTRPIPFGSSLEKYKKNRRPASETSRANTVTEDNEIVRVKTDLVVNDVLVTDQKGNTIDGLNRDDFVVTEQGVPQKIEMFSFGENVSIPRSIVLIIDDSFYQAGFFENSIRAAKFVIDKMKPNDKIAIATVNMKLLSDFTQDKAQLKETLDLLEKRGVQVGCGQDFDTLIAVLNEMFSAEDRRPIIIFQADGNEIIWLKDDKDQPFPVSDTLRDESGMKYTGKTKSMKNFGFSEVKEAIESSRATIYSVIPGTKLLGLSKKDRLKLVRGAFADAYRAMGFREDFPPILEDLFVNRDAEVRTAGQAAMSKVAELSGGRTGFINKPEDAERVYSEFLDVIEKRYSIGYYPSNQERDGRRREVRTQVRGHPEYIVTERRYYILEH